MPLPLPHRVRERLEEFNKARDAYFDNDADPVLLDALRSAYLATAERLAIVLEVHDRLAGNQPDPSDPNPNDRIRYHAAELETARRELATLREAARKLRKAPEPQPLHVALTEYPSSLLDSYTGDPHPDAPSDSIPIPPPVGLPDPFVHSEEEAEHWRKLNTPPDPEHKRGC